MNNAATSRRAPRARALPEGRGRRSAMHVLVTGGAGFIGSHLVDSLLADGHRVTVLDNFDPFYDRSVKEANIEPQRRHSSWRLVEADLRDAYRLRAVLFDDYDCIVHLAARAGVRPSIADPVGYQQAKVDKARSLLGYSPKTRISMVYDVSRAGSHRRDH